MTAGCAHRWVRRLAAIAIVALGAGGCTSRMAQLEGARGHTEWISGGDGGTAEVPSVFVLRNRTLGWVKVESMRTEAGTECGTVPPLPASIAPGKQMEVAVIARFPRASGDAVRTVTLESKGDEPLVLRVDGRFQPAAPVDAKPPQPIAPAGK